MRPLRLLSIALAILVAIWWFAPKPNFEVPQGQSEAHSTPATVGESKVEGQTLVPSPDQTSRESADPNTAPRTEPDPTPTLSPSPNQALIHARLIDAESGLPVVGAKLHRLPSYEGTRIGGAPWKAPRPWKAAGKPITISDASGLLHMKQIRDGFAVYEVHADGYAPTWVNQVSVQSNGGKPTEVQMRESGTLYGYISGPVPGGYETVSIGAHTSMELMPNSPKNMHFGENPDFTWKANCDANGGFELTGLPCDAALRIWIERVDGPSKEQKLLHLASKSIGLSPGESRRFNWNFSKGHVLEGFALAANSAPRKTWEIWAISRPEGSTRTRLQGNDRPLRTTQTDDKGFFRFDDLPRGHYLVGPKPPLSSTTHGKLVDVPSLEALLLQDPVMGYVEGVVTCEGLPVAGTRVTGRSLRSAITDKNGAFRLPCPVGETIRVTPMGPAMKYAFHNGVEATAGDTNIRIELTRSIDFMVHAIDDSTGEPVPAIFSLITRDGLQGMLSLSPPASSRTIMGIASGRYVIHASSPTGLAAWSDAIDLRSGSAQDDITLRMIPGGRLRILGLNDEESASIGILQGEERVLQCNANRGHTEFLIPPGTYRVDLRSKVKALKVPAGAIVIEAGKTFDLSITR